MKAVQFSNDVQVQLVATSQEPVDIDEVVRISDFPNGLGVSVAEWAPIIILYCFIK